MTEIPINDPAINPSAENPMIQHSVSEGLIPGDVIELADIRELVAFEDALAGSIDPKHDPDLWRSREKIGDLIRPPKFNGTIANIRLAVMAEPYERLLDAPERGWTGGKRQDGGGIGRNRELSPTAADQLKTRYQGFVFTADAKSSGKGTIGQIQAEMWYLPVVNILKAGSVRRYMHTLQSGETKRYTSTSTRDIERRTGKGAWGQEIQRVVTQPRLNKERFIELDTNSRRIGLEQLRKQFANPISTPMRD